MKLSAKVCSSVQYAKDVITVTSDIAQVMIYFLIAAPLAKVFNKSVK